MHFDNFYLREEDSYWPDNYQAKPFTPNFIKICYTIWKVRHTEVHIFCITHSLSAALQTIHKHNLQSQTCFYLHNHATNEWREYSSSHNCKNNMQSIQ